MDTRESYIRRCDCSEIQEAWLKLTGRIMPFDVCFVKPLGYTQHVLCCYEANTGNYLYFGQGHRNFEQRECIWLPKQGQWQRMLYPKIVVSGVSTHICTPFIGQLFDAFWRFAKKYLDYGKHGILPNNGISAEELWAAFYMHKLHKKYWKGDEEWKTKN